ncbi:MAG TPA: ATP-binding protein [Candidatus Rubrimentiphilum sp.]|nr:ATP-binding protein [Candidatus Rubrimentiphilum sp.]
MQETPERQALTPQLVHESRQPAGLPLPSGFEVIGRVVHWEGTPDFNDAAGLLNHGHEVKPGQFIGVWHGARQTPVLTVVQVNNCREVNPNEEPQLAVARDRLGLGANYAKEGISTRIFRLLESATIEEFDIDPVTGEVKAERGSPELLVRAGDPIVLLPDEMIARTIGSEPSAESGLALGHVYGAPAVPVNLKPELLQMHVGIFGQPGKGKSYQSGVVMEEALRWGIATLVLDINGEMIEAARALGGRVIGLPDPAAFGLSLGLITSSELIQIAPNVQDGTVYAELIELAHERLRTERHGGHFTFDDLQQKMIELAKIQDVKAPSLGIAVNRVRALEQDPIIGGSFDFIEELIKHRLVVLDCRFLSLRQTRLIAAAAARELQRKGREMARKPAGTDPEAAGWFTLLIVDEAHQVAPNDEHVVSSQVMFELARMGRHVRTGLVLVSQSPGDINPSVLKRLQTRFIFALEKDQLRAIQGVTADLDERLIGQLPKLPRGVCAVSGSSELIRHGFLLAVRKRETPVGGGTPKVFSGRKKLDLTTSLHRERSDA